MKFLFIFYFLTLIYAQTNIKDIISTRPELTKIFAHLKQSSLMSFFSSKQKNPITFFAPHNDAFMFMSNEMRDQLARMTDNMMNGIYNYHTIYRQWKTADINSDHQERISVKDLSTYIIVSRINQNVYVNGALIIVSDLVASNGFVHIIDRMLVDISLNGPVTNSFNNFNAYTYACQEYPVTIDKRLSTKEFCKLLNSLKRLEEAGTIESTQYGHTISDILANSESDNFFSTFFITNDNFMVQFQQKFQDKYQELLNNNPQLLQTVIESQIVPSKGYHSRIFLEQTFNSTIPAVHGETRLYAFNNMYSVSNKCKRANIVQANITVLNSVIYIIDEFLGLISNDLYMEIDTQSNLMSFKRNLNLMPPEFVNSLKISSGSTSSQISEYTIFAATGEVFDRISLSDDLNVLAQQMNMQFLKGSLSLFDLINGTSYPTLRNGYKLMFMQNNSDYFVEVDYVRAKIVEANICTKNGLIHKIDRILGVADRTVSDTLIYTPYFQRLVGYLSNVGYTTWLNDRQKTVTFFAPVDNSFQIIDDKTLLQQQNNNKLRNIFDRHVINTILFLDTIPINTERSFRTSNGDIKIRNTNNEYFVIIGSKTIRVLQANQRMINGVMHVVDQLLFDPSDPKTLESRVNSQSRVRTCRSVLLTGLLASSFYLL